MNKMRYIQYYLVLKKNAVLIHATAAETSCMEFFHGPEVGGGLRVIQAIIPIALYFYYYYISSTSDHQALDPRGSGPLCYSMDEL